MREIGGPKRIQKLLSIFKALVIPVKTGIQSGFPGCQQTFRETAKDQNGSVLVLALLILVFLTLIGITSSTISEIEIQIAGNDRAYNVAFYTADSGIYLTPKIVRKTVEDGARPSYASITYTPDDGTFFREVMGFNPKEDSTDLSFSLGGNSAEIDVQRVNQISLGGGGVEFGSGAEGVGVGSAGGVAIIYQLDSTGKGPINAQSEIRAEYSLIPGVPGGL